MPKALRLSRKKNIHYFSSPPTQPAPPINSPNITHFGIFVSFMRATNPANKVRLLGKVASILPVLISVSIVRSPTDAASQEAAVGPAQYVVVARARAPLDAVVQHCLEYLGPEHPNFELGGSAPTVVQFEDVLPESAPCVACTLIDHDGQVDIVVDVPPKVNEFVRFPARLACCLYAECGGGLRHPLRAKVHDLTLGLRYAESKHRAHDHEQPHHLPQLLGGLRDNPGIVSVKHALKQRH